MNIIAFKPEHAALMRLQPMQAAVSLDETTLITGPAWTGVADDLPVVCAGFLPIWEGRAMAWALVAADAGRHMAAIHRAALERVRGAGYRRLEAYVDPRFAAARRWVAMLGFEYEGLLKRFTPTGDDMELYCRG